MRPAYFVQMAVVAAALGLVSCGGGGGGSATTWVHPSGAGDYLSFDDSSVSIAQVVMNARGDAVLVWAQPYASTERIYMSERDGATGLWSHPSAATGYISPDGGWASYPSAALDDDGNAIVAWSQQDVAGSSWLFVSRRNGATGQWTHPADSDDHLFPCPAGNWPNTAVGGGDAIVAWNESSYGSSGHLFVSERDGAGGAWSAPVDLYVPVPSTFVLDRPQAAMDSHGGAIVAWSEFAFLGTAFIFVAERDGGTGLWDGPTDVVDTIAVAGSSPTNPRLGMARDGDAVVSWTETAAGLTRIYAATRDGASGDWTFPTGLGDRLSPDGTAARFNRSVVNSRGDAVVIWRQYDGDGYDQIFLSEKDGSTGLWDNPQDLADNISPDGTHAAEREVALDDRGHAVVAWLQNLAVGQGIFLAERLRTGDSWVLPADTSDFVSPDNGGSVLPPSVAVGGRGNAVVVWRQGEGSFNRLYMSEKK